MTSEEIELLKQILEAEKAILVELEKMNGKLDTQSMQLEQIANR